MRFAILTGLALLTSCAASAPPQPHADGPAGAQSAAEVTPKPAESTSVETKAADVSTGEAPKAESAAVSISVKANAVDDEAASAIFVQQNAELRKCYQKALEKDPATEAEWACFFVRDATGRVTSVDIPGEPFQELRKCIVKVVKAAKFPPPKQADAQQTFFVFMTKSAP